MTDARVMLWGTEIGAVSWIAERNVGVFQYTGDFAQSGIEVSPLQMPLRTQPYEFPELAYETYKGLPGLLSDSLPDKFGNAMIDAWLATQGREPGSMNPVERLRYIGTRGMGALEFRPGFERGNRKERILKIDALVDLTNQVLSDRQNLRGVFTGKDDHETIEDILRVGTSAGGARAKAILAWNEETNEFRSGQIDMEEGYTAWLMKFDGIDENKDKELVDPKGYGLIEYAYHLMAVKAGIQMMPCRVHEEGGRSHFMTQRFDRTAEGDKLHVQTLGGLMHYDYNQPASYSYEQALQAMIRLDLSMDEIEEQFRRTVFNVIARNQDDHVKNIAFLMDRAGKWALSPAYDVAYSYNPGGAWTGKHQMSVNGKREDFELDDLLALAAIGDVKAGRAKQIVEQVHDAVSRWEEFASEAGVFEEHAARVKRAMWLDLGDRN